MIHAISNRSTFADLRRQGVRAHGRPVRIDHLPAAVHGDDCDRVRVGFSISARIGGAVVRNKIRRRLRSIMTELDRADMLPSGAYVIVAKPDILLCSYADLANEVADVCGKAFRKAESATWADARDGSSR